MASASHPMNAPYGGAVGTTRRCHVHVACTCGAHHAVEIVESIDAGADETLARQLIEGVAVDAMTCAATGARVELEHPVVYHDGARGVFALVLPPSYRTRELDERIALLTALAADPSPIPGYVIDFGVCYGARELAAQVARAADGDLADRRSSVNGGRPDLDDLAATLSQREDALVVREAELARREAEFERQRAARRASERSHSDSGTAPFLVARADRAPTNGGAAVSRRGWPASVRGGGAATDGDFSDDEESTTGVQAPPGDTGGVTRVVRPDGQPEHWTAIAEPVARRLEGDEVRLSVHVSPAERDSLRDGALGARVQLHRLPSYPLITIALGTLSGSSGSVDHPVFVSFDLQSEIDRPILAALGRRFRFTLEMHDDHHDSIGRRDFEAPLADNLRYVLSAAGDHLKRVLPAERSFSRALAAFAAPGHDRLLRQTPVPTTAEIAALDDLATATAVRRAIAATQHMSEPATEELILCAAGVPMAEWHGRRRRVLERAAELGLWVGPGLAQLAVSEGLARSRKELVVRLRRQFTNLLAGRSHGLDDAAVTENWQALRVEAGALGVSTQEVAPARAEPIASDADSTASGTIGSTTHRLPRHADDSGARIEVEGLDRSALIELLADRTNRLPAAIELARGGDAASIEPVFNALGEMSRGEAGRLLGAAVGFGRQAVPHLVARLKARKGFLRQGAALALAVLRAEDAIEDICDLVVSEPTEIWREVARALGEVGAPAVMPLAARVATTGEEGHERIAWALAHVAARGAQEAVEAVLAGRDPATTAVARRAIELIELAQRDHLMVRSDPREQTVNRAFSRGFFEAMSAPAIQVAVGGGVDLSAPAVLLEEADLLESADLDSEGELDDGDLLPS